MIFLIIVKHFYHVVTNVFIHVERRPHVFCFKSYFMFYKVYVGKVLRDIFNKFDIHVFLVI